MPQALIGILGIVGIILLAHHIIMYWHAEPKDRPTLAYRIALLIACLLLISGSDHLISIFYAILLLSSVNGLPISSSSEVRLVLRGTFVNKWNKRQPK